jgi:hypothetical protein
MEPHGAFALCFQTFDDDSDFRFIREACGTSVLLRA